MAAKAKQEVKLHPLLKFDGADPRLVERVMAGAPLIALKQMKRDGKVYEPGDQIVLGQFKHDGSYLRPNPVTGGKFVTTPEAYEFAQYDSERRHYERKVLEPLRNRLNWAERDLGNAEGRVTALHAQLKQSNGELRQARAAEKNARAEYEQALETAPKAPA